jgi:hypothetical protein
MFSPLIPSWFSIDSGRDKFAARGRWRLGWLGPHHHPADKVLESPFGIEGRGGMVVHPSLQAALLFLFQGSNRHG